MEGETLKVSVVVPTYYRPNDLSELFDSLLRQTVKPFEVIVIDDTPTDAVYIVCEKYKTKFESVGTGLIYTKNPRERSAAIARNVGAEIARGDIMLFLDSDVFLYRNYIEKILQVFQNYSNAVGVQGWIVPRMKKLRHHLLRYFLNQLIVRPFLLGHSFAKERCRFLEYPIILTQIRNCETLTSSNMAVKRDILREFTFDENLKNYSFMEDLLFSYSVLRKYSQSLYITPYAKCIHKRSDEGRLEKAKLTPHLNSCRKYVLTKIFGWKGLLIYYWQDIGLIIVGLKRKLGNLLSLS